MPWIIERKHDHVAVVTMNTNKVNAQNPTFFDDLHMHSTASKRSSRTAQPFSPARPPPSRRDSISATTSPCSRSNHSRRSMRGSMPIAPPIFASSRILGQPWRRSTAMHTPAAYCEIIKHAIGPRAANELTLFGQVYDLAAATRMGVIDKSAGPSRLLDDAVAWAALVPPDCYPAYAVREARFAGDDEGRDRRRGAARSGLVVASHV
jgi:enoyl-CoA hydratase